MSTTSTTTTTTTTTTFGPISRKFQPLADNRYCSRQGRVPLRLHPNHRLVGLVVKASASRAEDSGFESLLRRNFSESSHTSISVWQHVKLSEPFRPWDTFACCWDVKQPTNKHLKIICCMFFDAVCFTS